MIQNRILVVVLSVIAKKCKYQYEIVNSSKQEVDSEALRNHQFNST